MASLADLEAEREAIKRAMSQGVESATYLGRTVKYRSIAEMDLVLKRLDRDIAALTQGRRPIRQMRFVCGKGL
ncbi:phage head-tail joining protein [Roseomonas sp. F4]